MDSFIQSLNQEVARRKNDRLIVDENGQEIQWTLTMEDLATGESLDLMQRPPGLDQKADMMRRVSGINRQRMIVELKELDTDELIGLAVNVVRLVENRAWFELHGFALMPLAARISIAEKIQAIENLSDREYLIALIINHSDEAMAQDARLKAGESNHHCEAALEEDAQRAADLVLEKLGITLDVDIPDMVFHREHLLVMAAAGVKAIAYRKWVIEHGLREMSFSAKLDMEIEVKALVQLSEEDLERRIEAMRLKWEDQTIALEKICRDHQGQGGEMDWLD